MSSFTHLVTTGGGPCSLRACAVLLRATVRTLRATGTAFLLSALCAACATPRPSSGARLSTREYFGTAQGHDVTDTVELIHNAQNARCFDKLAALSDRAARRIALESPFLFSNHMPHKT
ncbi:hypothetical protein PPGU19_085690 (plasmid) [Paraburkholderia sp. PGU19]|nr:hypothetical protein PPGU19_085690 [Paraburkholderia sp. PGU19]